MTNTLDDSGGSVDGAVFGSHAEDPLSTTNGNYEFIPPPFFIASDYKQLNRYDGGHGLEGGVDQYN